MHSIFFLPLTIFNLCMEHNLGGKTRHSDHLVSPIACLQALQARPVLAVLASQRPNSSMYIYTAPSTPEQLTGPVS